DWCERAFAGVNLVDAIQLHFALDVETVNALSERVLDFLARLSDAGKGAFRGIASCGNDAEKFAAGNDVEPSSFFGKQTQDCAIRIRFDRITNQMIQRRESAGRADSSRGERGIESAVMIENRSRAVDVERRPKFLHDPRKIDIFAMKLPFAVMKRMHYANAIR